MHTLMSFVGAIGNLMADTGLESIMEVAFGGFAKMLSGNLEVSPECESTPASRRGITPVINNDTQSYLDLMRELQHRVSLSRTCKLWLDNLINLFIWGFFYIAFNTVQVISRRVVGRAEETSTYSSLEFCTVNC